MHVSSQCLLTRCTAGNAGAADGRTRVERVGGPMGVALKETSGRVRVCVRSDESLRPFLRDDPGRVGS